MDHKGLQALHHASLHGLPQLVSALLQKGAVVEARAGKLRLTPLMIGEEGAECKVQGVGLMYCVHCRSTSSQLLRTERRRW